MVRYLKAGLFILSGTCEQVSRLISDECDRPLTAEERWASRVHLAYCPQCHRFRVQVRHINSHLKEHRLAPGLSLKARDRIARRLEKLNS
ncbi:MAG: zf-HC2 domain-containing protein [Planctomycetota bacterium]